VVCFSLSDENGVNIDMADDHPTPDNELDRGWARGVIERALHACSLELHAQGRAYVWDCLEENIVRGCRAACPQSGALRTALHRAKRRLRALILTECREDEHTLHAVLA
jgi:hypothetical protein